MSSTTGHADPPRFEPGDRVRAAQGIGGMFRPRVHRDTPGIIAGLTPDGHVVVHFITGHREAVDPQDLVPLEP